MIYAYLKEEWVAIIRLLFKQQKTIYLLILTAVSNEVKIVILKWANVVVKKQTLLTRFVMFCPNFTTHTMNKINSVQSFKKPIKINLGVFGILLYIMYFSQLPFLAIFETSFNLKIVIKHGNQHSCPINSILLVSTIPKKSNLTITGFLFFDSFHWRYQQNNTTWSLNILNNKFSSYF